MLPAARQRRIEACRAHGEGGVMGAIEDLKRWDTALRDKITLSTREIMLGEWFDVPATIVIWKYNP